MSVWLRQLDDSIQFDFADTYESVKSQLQGRHDYRLVMLDLGMPGMQGVLSIQELSELAGECPVLIVSADESGAAVRSAMEAGAAGYVRKSASGEEILDAVRTVINGEAYFPDDLSMTGSLVNQLSHKQRQLLALLAEGNSNKEISEKLFLSEGTVKQYVSQLFRLLDVDNRTQAGIRARELLRINNS